MYRRDEEKEKRIKTIENVIENQVLQRIDAMRSKVAWTTLLDKYSHDEIAEALVLQLSGGRYIQAPRCNCCCRQHQ
ncbi:hypothetical protein [Pandoraea fibrosis]|uniref:Uncharacterized protein n=1 Tax=Pandoraea fibrosis TaxID=1891094 RepID=A0A5E4SR29_9BURK|nr:hypothetical protein [Pandoraea fibrosis]VVD78200.1 hypothetical protein PFI31113_00969 [Pandoraea fibrosis]